MQFAIFLLVLLAAACSVGSLITQGQSFDWYAARYSERTAALILALHLDDAFHSGWFLLITAFLCANLLLCNVVRLPQLLRRTRDAGRAPDAAPDGGDLPSGSTADPEAVFRALHMPAPRRAEAGGTAVLYASKHTAGLWGPWVCHLGILLLIAGFALGQFTLRQYTVYGVPGQTRAVGDTALQLTIDDFRVDRREDGSAAQYETAVTLRRNGEAQSASVRVNGPATLFGYRLYQNSTGWAAKVTVLKDGEPLQEEVLCAGEMLPVADKPALVVALNALYPDFAMTPAGPVTLSESPADPGYLYTVYFHDQILGMNVLTGGETITIDEYEVIFSEPRPYTLLQLKRDAYTPLALAGGLIVLLGLVLAFYVQPVQVWAVPSESGWIIRGRCRKNGVLFREQFDRALQGADHKEE